MSDPFEPEHDDATAPEAAPAPAPESPEPESAVSNLDAEIQYAPTVVNSQAHEKIQAGERAQGVGLTVDASDR